ncbi:hypothetical protein CCHR01_10507 [Colletotrichum chrysophilum]|uniref:Uncharacterized protein n=1 Tax=Colletotrichum chrysophilum TaxID=1836956 RepID=A0AAD9AGF3_9PEZI|nr:hypothetical protein CCHR01_10507 [Colletotrichum chrysophilum]
MELENGPYLQSINPPPPVRPVRNYVLQQPSARQLLSVNSPALKIMVASKLKIACETYKSLYPLLLGLDNYLPFATRAGPQKRPEQRRPLVPLELFRFMFIPTPYLSALAHENGIDRVKKKGTWSVTDELRRHGWASQASVGHAGWQRRNVTVSSIFDIFKMRTIETPCINDNTRWQES